MLLRLKRKREKIKILNLIILSLFGFQGLSRWNEEGVGLTLLIIILIIVSTLIYFLSSNFTFFMIFLHFNFLFSPNVHCFHYPLSLQWYNNNILIRWVWSLTDSIVPTVFRLAISTSPFLVSPGIYGNEHR